MRIEEPRYEYCMYGAEIVSRSFFRTMMRCVAQGTGLNSNQVYARSNITFRSGLGNDVQEQYDAEQEVKSQLLQDGWEEAPEGRYPFRRRVHE